MATKPSTMKRTLPTKVKPSKKKPVKKVGDDAPPCACVPLAPQGLGKWQLVDIDGVMTWENVTP